MNLILYDPAGLAKRLFPVTLSRPVAGIRTGILTIAEKWQISSGGEISFLTEKYLQEKYPANPGQDNIFIDGSVLPNPDLIDRIMNLKLNEALIKNGVQVAHRTNVPESGPQNFRKSTYEKDLQKINRLADVFLFNGTEIVNDLSLMKKKKGKIPADDHSAIYSAENVFIGDRVSLKACIIDADSGPVFIGDDVTVQPGAVIAGPSAILNGSVLSMGARIRPNTTLGPFCKVGGEVSNVVFQGYSNKSHDGFLGNSVIGEWCNLGAGTNNSNLKNNYSDIRVWDYEAEKMISTGLQYFGLIMGDHTRCGINTMFNTGTVAGFSANIFDGGYMPKFIPSFAWGNREGFTTYELEKAIYTAGRVMERRSVSMTDIDSAIFEYIFNFTGKYRQF